MEEVDEGGVRRGEGMWGGGRNGRTDGVGGGWVVRGAWCVVGGVWCVCGGACVVVCGVCVSPEGLCSGQSGSCHVVPFLCGIIYAPMVHCESNAPLHQD